MILATNPSINAATAPALADNAPWGASWLGAAVLALLAAGIPALWPGDGVWLWDEPMEIARALQCNQEHRLAFCGLSGSFPVPFGALGIQLYQLWLIFTHNPLTLVVLHALTTTVPTAVALLWLSRTLRLNPWFAAAILAGPHLWFEARRLWQPSFCISLGTMAMAAHASFVLTRSGRSLLLAIACAIAPLFIHLQAIPLSAAILGHLIYRHRAELRRHQLGIAGVLVCFAALQGPYVVAACGMILYQCVSFIRTGHNSNTPAAQAWLGPFLSGRIFSGWDWGVGQGALAMTLGALASGAMVLSWLGIGLAAWKVAERWRVARVPYTSGNRLESPADAVRATVLLVCAGGVAIHLAMCIAGRLATVHHYFFGTFGMYVVLAWLALHALPHWSLRVGIIAVHGIAGAVMTGGVILRIHADGWTHGYGPTIGEQVALVRQLDRYSDRTAYTEVPSYMERPFVLLYLRQLLGSDPPLVCTWMTQGDRNLRHWIRSELPPERRVLSGRLFIRYRQDAAGHKTNRIELVETDAEPAGAKRIAVVPDP